MAWFTIAPAIVLVVALLVVPGFLANVGFLRLSTPAALLLAVPVSAGVLGLAAPVFGLAGIPWTLATVSVATVVLAGVVAWLVIRRRRSQKPTVLGFITWSHLAWVGVGTLVFAVIQGAMILPAIGYPQAVPTVGDAQFHIQGLKLIAESGSASPIGPFGFLYGSEAGESSPFYPTLWHSLAAPTLPFTSLVGATNATAIAVGLIFWPWSLAGLAVALVPKRPIAGFIAPVLASGMVLMPGIQLFGFAVYPLALSVVLIAGAFAFLALLIGKFSFQALAGLLLSAVGATAAQPTAGLIVALAAMCWALVAIAAWVIRAVRRGRWFAGIAASALTLAFIVALGVLLPRVGMIQALNRRQTESISTRDAVLNLTLGPTYVMHLSLLVTLLFGLAIVGSLWTIRRRANLVLTITALALLVLYVAAAGPDSYLRIFTSPWWKDASRFATYLMVLVVCFAAVALAKVLAIAGLRSHQRMVDLITGAVVVLGCVAAWIAVPNQVFSRQQVTDFIVDTYERSDDSKIGLTEDELELLLTLDQHLEPGTVVVGDPDSGVAWVNIFSEARPFQSMRMPRTAGQVYLGENFDSIMSDPKVCEIVNEGGIEAFIQTDSPTKEFERRYVGFNATDTGAGFELLEQVGGARLYRITACD